MLNMIGHVSFPRFSGIRCLMMPFIQGEPDSLPGQYAAYREIVSSLYHQKGDVGFLTIDESPVVKGNPHRGQRAKTTRALHTEAGRDPEKLYCWGDGGGWGRPPHRVTLDRNVEILLASNLDRSCAVWPTEHEDTSSDGDIGDKAVHYPYEDAVLLKAGEVCRIGILTPHESLPVESDFDRQFLRIISSGVYGREPYFTQNPIVPHRS